MTELNSFHFELPKKKITIKICVKIFKLKNEALTIGQRKNSVIRYCKKNIKKKFSRFRYNWIQPCEYKCKKYCTDSSREKYSFIGCNFFEVLYVV
ncbi:hypothetical protein MXB_2335 [Myxobolus squamalis]|nr:hypothetical protein MXB_2335 [Myxobolus squamalis]